MLTGFLRQIIPAGLRPIRHLENLVRAQTGGRVRQGPFAGLRYINRAVGSAFIPKLLGIYERELNGCIEAACAAQFPLIVDVGAAEGYYAIGLARRNPAARVIAFEMEETGREALKEMAKLNGIEVAPKTERTKTNAEKLKTEKLKEDAAAAVSISAFQPFSVSAFQKVPLSRSPVVSQAQLEIHGKCEFENLQATLASADRALVVCDVEGYEEFLLVPEKIPALARATLLVEMHDCFRPGLTELITERFAATHQVERIWQEPRLRADFPFTSWGTRLFPKRYLDWAVSEWRPVRMSWLWMKPKAGSR
jgi:FkbM family methyltransferase